jgi:universal stress protein A
LVPNRPEAEGNSRRHQHGTQCACRQGGVVAARLILHEVDAMEKVRRILCPIDFSESSQKAFRYAERLSASSGAELLLLHAFDVPQSHDSRSQWTPADPELEGKLREIKPTASQVKVDYALHAGPPGEVICWLAQQRECDLIVIGTHGRTGLRHLVFGSVAEHVLRHARCPVLVIRDWRENEPKLQEPMVLPPPAPRLM